MVNAETLVTKILSDTDTGANGKITIPVNTTFEILGIQVKLVADGNAADRTIELRFVDEDNDSIFRISDDNNITLSQTRRVNFTIGGNKYESADIFHNALPPFIMSEGYDLDIIINNIQAGDVHTTTAWGYERVIGEHVLD